MIVNCNAWGEREEIWGTECPVPDCKRDKIKAKYPSRTDNENNNISFRVNIQKYCVILKKNNFDERLFQTFDSSMDAGALSSLKN